MFHWTIVRRWTKAWLYDQTDPLAGYLPTRIIFQAAVRESTLSPATEGKPETPVFIGHIQTSGFDNTAVHASLDSALLASGVEDVVDGSHGRNLISPCPARWHYLLVA